MTSRSLCATLALSTLLFAPSQGEAFQHDHNTGDLQGPTRVIVAHDAAQQILSAQHEGWAQFKATYGSDWNIRWDEAAETPHRIWGSGIDLGSLDDVDAAVANALEFLQQNEALVGVPTSDLTLLNTGGRNDIFVMSFQRSINNIAVNNALVDLVFSHGKLVSMGFDSYPNLSIDTLPKLNRATALQSAKGHLNGQFDGVEDLKITHQGELVVVPQEVGNGLRFNLAWRNTIETSAPVGEWISYVDAQTGKVISQHNNIKFASGTVEVEYEERAVGDSLVVGGAAHMDIRTGGAPTSTDADGAYSSNASGPFSGGFTGDFFDVSSRTASEVSGSWDDGDFLFEFTDARGGTAAQNDTFVGGNIVRARALSITPDLPELQQTMIAIVDKPSSCNAFYNGNINFLSENFQCNNTGRIQDVIYHEYGHHYHSSLRESGTVDGSIGEGSGDYLSATIVNECELAPTFLKRGGGSGAIRNCEEDRVYPEDLTGAVHTDGLIWAGALWDLRKSLIARDGYDAGVATTDALFANALTQGPTLSNCYQAVLVADDDDGNLFNGTPNQSEIDAAFGAHGLD